MLKSSFALKKEAPLPESRIFRERGCLELEGRCSIYLSGRRAAQSDRHQISPKEPAAEKSTVSRK